MYFRAIAGIVAGLCSGVVSGIMFLLMKVPEVDGLSYNVLQLIARAVGSNDASVGWSYHLFNAAVIGLIFGMVVGQAVTRLLNAVGFGLIASLSCWMLANLVLLPRLSDIASSTGGVTRVDGATFTPFGLATAIGYLVEGIMLGVIFLWVYDPIRLADYHEQQARIAADADADAAADAEGEDASSSRDDSLRHA